MARRVSAETRREEIEKIEHCLSEIDRLEGILEEHGQMRDLGKAEKIIHMLLYLRDELAE